MAQQDTPMDILDKLVALRKGQGISQLDLANRLDLGQSRISKLELSSDAMMSSYIKYANALGYRLFITFVKDPDVRHF